MKEWYKEDLAYIHDVGHGDFALGSAPGIVEILRRSGIERGLVVDLGCGSGILARELTKARYRVLGIDISESMIAIARRRAPKAEFRLGSLFKAQIPPCQAVTSIGECFNYLFDSDNDREALFRLFRRVYGALTPGGVFIFDIAEPGQVARGAISRGFAKGRDWAVLSEKEEDWEHRELIRRITCFRKVGRKVGREVGQCYRRSEETHRQRLYKAADVASELRRAGFSVRTMRAYGAYPLPRAHAAFAARKAAKQMEDR